jgi:hypothetical protein
MPRVELLLGGPGTGKTAALLDLIEEAIASGVEPDRIAFASVTRAATREGTGRAVRRFELDESDLPHFRTLHSLAFRAGRVRRAGVEMPFGLRIAEAFGHVVHPAAHVEMFGEDNFVPFGHQRRKPQAAAGFGCLGVKIPPA